MTDLKVNNNSESAISLLKSNNNAIQINEISGSELKNNTKTTGNGGGINNIGAYILKISDTVFENDGMDYTINGTRGGAIYNSGVIDKIENVTITECHAYNGGAIYNIGQIGSIIGLTISDTKTSDVLIASELNGTIGTIDNITIENGSGTGLSFWWGGHLLQLYKTRLLQICTGI